jgi:uncharacterized protein YbjT (DUF2867 family)
MLGDNMDTRRVLVFGATGNVGGAAARELLKRGWHVRAVTRNPQGERALALADLGAEVVRADMEDRPSLEAAFNGMVRVFSVQNWTTGGVEAEFRQGVLVADVAAAAGVEHLVFGSAGIGEPGTGVPHFDSKLAVEGHMRQLGLPVTAVRPGPFMELMTAREFYPPLAAWGTMPRIVGMDTPLPWTAVRDIGVAIANILADPVAWIGRDVNLIGDFKSLRECRAIFHSVTGRRPFGLPLPVGLFQRMAGQEFVQMWRWLDKFMADRGPNGLTALMAAANQACPNRTSVESWLRIQRNGNGG